MKDELRYYIRNNKGHPIAILLAKKVKKDVIISWAKCHKQLDKWDKNRGVAVAIGRIESMNIKGITPYCIKKYIPTFIKRAKKYFKVDIVLMLRDWRDFHYNSEKEPWKFDYDEKPYLPYEPYIQL